MGPDRPCAAIPSLYLKRPGYVWLNRTRPGRPHPGHPGPVVRARNFLATDILKPGSRGLVAHAPTVRPQPLGFDRPHTSFRDPTNIGGLSDNRRRAIA